MFLVQLPHLLHALRLMRPAAITVTPIPISNPLMTQSGRIIFILAIIKMAEGSHLVKIMTKKLYNGARFLPNFARIGLPKKTSVAIFEKR